MKTRWDPGFTIVELLIAVSVIAILTSVTVVTYNGLQLNARQAAAQSDLRNVLTEIQLAQISNPAPPSAIPDSVKPSGGVTLEMVRSGATQYYSNLSAVQNGVLLSKICSDLIAEGLGNGKDQSGATRPYLTGCGNWNNNSMQVTGWQSRVWQTPIASQQFRDYAAAFTTNSAWDKDQERVVKAFYTQLVDRLLLQGGRYPVTSFWDSWANSNNGGVIKQELPTGSQMKQYYCIEARIDGQRVWHVDESGVVKEGTC